MLYFKEKTSFVEYLGSLDLLYDRNWEQYTKLRQISGMRHDEAKPLLLQASSYIVRTYDGNV